MKMSAAGRQALTKRENLRLTAYPDGGGVWTIGVGHTAAAGEPHPRHGMTITRQQADEILSRDLNVFEMAVNNVITREMEQNEFDAMVSLAFNIGAHAFVRSSVVRRFNRGDKNGAAEAFLMWNKDNGKVVRGLVNRRISERKQFLGLE